MINFRDLAEASEKLRKGLIFRSAGPLFSGNHPDLARIHTWIDLRTEEEWETCILPQFPRRVPVPMDLADDQFRKVSKPNRQDWVGLYQRGFERNLPGFVEVLELIHSEPKPLLFSCAVGRDRTGVAAALLLYLLGVENEAIVHDYCRTSEAARLLAAHYMPQLLGRGLSEEEVLSSYFICEAEVVADLLDYFSAHEARILGELGRLGFEQPKLNDLRRNLLNSSSR